MQMANGEMLKELRRMAETSDLSFRDAQRLTLSVLAELYEGWKEHIQVEESMQDCMQTIEEKVDTVSLDMAALKKQVQEVNDNPLVGIGKHLKAHPKLAVGYVIIGMILITWLPYINLIRILLLWLGVPSGIVDTVAPGGP
jgi:hypothetical protein